MSDPDTHTAALPLARRSLARSGYLFLADGRPLAVKCPMRRGGGVLTSHHALLLKDFARLRIVGVDACWETKHGRLRFGTGSSGPIVYISLSKGHGSDFLS